MKSGVHFAVPENLNKWNTNRVIVRRELSSFLIQKG